MVRNEWKVDVRDEENDDWTLIKDVAARKRAQNRLAQRAHRRKYGRGKKLTQELGLNSPFSPMSVGVAETNANDQQSLLVDVSDRSVETILAVEAPDVSFIDTIGDQSDNSLAVAPCNGLSCSENAISQALSTPNLVVNAPTFDTIMIQTTMTLSAILMNASLVYIPCSPSKRAPAIHIHRSTPTPPSLAPTDLQQRIPHLPYVALLPFPSLRDQLLKAGDIVDSEEIWADLQTDVKVWGSSPWDEKGWEVGERFAVKWWFLMSEDVLNVANWWRGLRGEKWLSMAGIRAAFGNKSLIGVG